MKRNLLLLFLLSAILTACISIDITPSYYGTYKTDFTFTETVNGVNTSTNYMTGNLNVGSGSVNKTLNIDNVTDIYGVTIDFGVLLGRYFYSEKYTYRGCDCENTIEGKFERNKIKFKHTVSEKCGKDHKITMTEGEGSK